MSGKDYVGRECSEEETAKGLGFFNVEAFRQFKIKCDRNTDAAAIRGLIADVCNQGQMILELQTDLRTLQQRLA